MGASRCTFSADDVVVKSPNDRRLYRLIQLDNGLSALHVHDPEIYPDGPPPDAAEEPDDMDCEDQSDDCDEDGDEEDGDEEDDEDEDEDEDEDGYDEVAGKGKG